MRRALRRQLLQFQLTVNITAVTLTFVTAIGSETEESVLTPAQLLWVNLIMDTFAALALATDPASEAVLHRKPEGAGASLVSATGWKMILGQAVYQLGVILALNFAGARFLGLPEQEGDRTLQTLVFNTFVWMQVFNLLK